MKPVRIRWLFHSCMVLILLISGAMASLVLTSAWDDYIASRRGRHAMETLVLALLAAEKLSYERGPTSTVLGLSAPISAEEGQSLAAARQGTDDALNALADSLSRDESQSSALLVPSIRSIHGDLIQTRQRVDAFVARPPSLRHSSDEVSVFVTAMIALVPRLAPAIDLTEAEIVSADALQADAVAIARLSSEYSEYAGQMGSAFAAPVVARRPLTGFESLHLEWLVGRADELARHLNLSIQRRPRTGPLQDACARMQEGFETRGRRLIDQMTQAGRTHGTYGMSMGAFTAAYVPELQTIVMARDAALATATQEAQTRETKASIELAFAVMGMLLLVMALGTMWVLFGARAILPMSVLTTVVSRFAAGDLEAEVPLTERSDEIGELARSVGLLKESLLRNLQMEGDAARSEAKEREARVRAEAGNRAKSIFLASMSHELRTPLTAIIGFVRLLEQEVPALERDSVGIVKRNAEHLLALINDLLDMASAESGQIRLFEEDLDLSQLISDVTEMMRHAARARGLQFNVDRGPEVPGTICTDARRLRQVLLNLCGNAVKYCTEGGVTMRVRWHAPSGMGVIRLPRLEFEVEDTGPGISPEDIGRVFEPFVRLERDARSADGAGLGLPITRELVRLLGGEIFVTSEPGHGSCFRFEIPVLEAVSGSWRKVSEGADSHDGPAGLFAKRDPDRLPALNPQSLREVSVEIQADLRAALRCGRLLDLDEVIGRIRRVDEGLADDLQCFCDGYHFRELLDLLDPNGRATGHGTGQVGGNV